MALNARQEKFAQAVASGYDATEAMTIAGYSGGYGSDAKKSRAYELRHHKGIAARIKELMAETAKQSAYDRQYMLDKLAGVIDKAEKGDTAAHQAVVVQAVAQMNRIQDGDTLTLRDERESAKEEAPDLAATLEEFSRGNGAEKPKGMVDDLTECEGEA